MFKDAASKTKVRVLAAFILFFAVAVCASSVVLLNRVSQKYDQATLKIESVDNVRVKLDEVEAELWRIISNPESKKEDIKNSKLYAMLDNISQTVSKADADTKIQQVKDKLYRVERSLQPLIKGIHSLEEKQEDKKMDEEFTAIYMPDSKSLTQMSDSYADESEKIIEKIRFSKEIINKNISEYVSAELLEFNQLNKDIRSFSKKWVAVLLLAFFFVMALIIVFIRKIE